MSRYLVQFFASFPPIHIQIHRQFFFAWIKQNEEQRRREKPCREISKWRFCVNISKQSVPAYPRPAVFPANPGKISTNGSGIREKTNGHMVRKSIKPFLSLPHFPSHFRTRWQTSKHQNRDYAGLIEFRKFALRE